MSGRWWIVWTFILSVLLVPSKTWAWYGGNSTALARPHSRQWVVRATVRCQQRRANSSLCGQILGSLIRVDMNMTIRQDYRQPGITFTASYLATGAPLQPGAGLRPYGRLCSFGLLADRVRFVRGPFDGGTVCRASVHGSMILRNGADTHQTGQPDFWVTREVASVRGALAKQIVDPIGAHAYPVDSRLPYLPKHLYSLYNTAQALKVLGVNGFQRGAVVVPAGVSIKLSLFQMPLGGR